MAYHGPGNCIPGMVAAGDLSSDQYKFVTIGATGAALNAVNGARVDGVLQNKPAALGRAAAVQIDGITKIVAGAAIAAGADVMSDATGRAVTSASVAAAATKTFGNAATYNMAAGDTMVIDVDNVGNATATWDAAAASITDTTTYPVADQDTLTCIITITGGEWDGIAQTVTFARTTTTALLVAQGINDQAKGCSAQVVGGQVQVDTDGQGTGYAIAIAAGTGALTWAAATAGTGDVADINAVTAAEVETVIEADTTALVDVTGAAPVITSPTTGITSELDFKSGNALTIFGLSVEVVVGTASDSHTRGTLLEEAATAAGDIVSMALAPTNKV